MIYTKDAIEKMKRCIHDSTNGYCVLSKYGEECGDEIIFDKFKMTVPRELIRNKEACLTCDDYMEAD